MAHEVMESSKDRRRRLSPAIVSFPSTLVRDKRDDWGGDSEQINLSRNITLNASSFNIADEFFFALLDFYFL